MDRHFLKLLGPKKYNFLISAVILYSLLWNVKEYWKSHFYILYWKQNEKWAKKESVDGENTHKNNHYDLEIVLMHRHLHMHLSDTLQVWNWDNEYKDMHFKLVYLKLLRLIFPDLLICDLFLKIKLSF